MPLFLPHSPRTVALLLCCALLAPLSLRAEDHAPAFGDGPAFTCEPETEARDPFAFLALEDTVERDAPAFDDTPYPRDYGHFLAQAPKTREAFMAGDFAAAARIAREALAHVTPSDPRAGEYDICRALRDLERMLVAAERLQTRDEAEAALAAAQLRLSGVVAARRDGRVMLNGRVLKCGDAFALGNGDERAVVCAIRFDEAVVLYRNVRIALPVGE